MCTTDTRCLREGTHEGKRHRFVQSRKERLTANLAARSAHISTTETTKIGRYTLMKGDAVRLQMPPGKHKWLGVFQGMETNARSNKTVAVVVGGKKGGAVFTKYLDPGQLIYLRPDSADAKQAQITVAMAKPAGVRS